MQTESDEDKVLWKFFYLNSFNHLQCREKPALPTIHSWLFQHRERPQKALFDTAFILTLQEPTRVNNWRALILSKLSAETKLTCDNNEYINRVKRVTNMFVYRRITLKIDQSRNTRFKIKAEGFVSQLTLCLQLSTVIDALCGWEVGPINLHFKFDYCAQSIRHFRTEKETGPSKLSQRLLGPLLRTSRRKLANSWPARPH